MTTETLIEEGIVLESSNGEAIIELLSNDNCHSCGAKPFCKPEDNEKNKLKVSDPYGVFPGDKVKIAVEGKTIVFATLTLYGFPLLLLTSSILIGLHLFSKFMYPELLSFLLAVSATTLYYLILFRISSKKSANSSPKIIFVER